MNLSRKNRALDALLLLCASTFGCDSSGGDPGVGTSELTTDALGDVLDGPAADAEASTDPLADGTAEPPEALTLPSCDELLAETSGVAFGEAGDGAAIRFDDVTQLVGLPTMHAQRAGISTGPRARTTTASPRPTSISTVLWIC